EADVRQILRIVEGAYPDLVFKLRDEALRGNSDVDVQNRPARDTLFGDIRWMQEFGLPPGEAPSQVALLLTCYRLHQGDSLVPVMGISNDRFAAVVTRTNPGVADPAIGAKSG